DAWLNSAEPNEADSVKLRTAEAQQIVGDSFAVAPRDPVARRLARHRALKPLVAIACLLASLAAALILYRRQMPATVPSLGPERLTYDGGSKLFLRTDGANLYFNEIVGARLTLMSMAVNGGPIHPIDTNFPNVMLQDVSKDGQTLLVTSSEGLIFGG